MTSTAVVINDVSKRFRIYHERNQTLKAAVMRGRRSVYEDFWALKDVTFEVPVGTTFGLMGNNGSGKSTLLKCIAQIYRPTSGTVTRNGRIAALLEVGSGFHPELSGRENVYLNGSILGMSKEEIDKKFDDIVGFSGVEHFIDQPVKNYSSGMYVRLGFSVAIHVDPEILVVDEVLAVGDAAFQEKCGEKFAQFRREGRTVILVSHALGTMKSMCDQGAWLDKGKLVEIGDARDVVEKYSDASRGDLRVESDSPSGDRWGTGDAIITDIGFFQDGQPVSKVESGSRVTVRLAYEAMRRIDRPVFGLALEASDGTYLWANNTADARFQPEYIEGHGIVECTIPRFAFQPNRLNLIASIVDTTMTRQYDFARNVATIDVTHGPLRESGGYVALDGTWRLGK